MPTGTKQNGMNITFYIDNKQDQPKEVSCSQILADFFADPEMVNRYHHMPFERIILTHMSKYGSFGVLTPQEWECLEVARKDKGQNVLPSTKEQDPNCGEVLVTWTDQRDGSAGGIDNNGNHWYGILNSGKLYEVQKL